jgi:hypothetical protein
MPIITNPDVQTILGLMAIGYLQLCKNAKNPAEKREAYGLFKATMRMRKLS